MGKIWPALKPWRETKVTEWASDTAICSLTWDALARGNTTYGRDAILSRFKLDALAAGDGKTLRLTGTVATAAQKLRAQQLAQRNFKTVINEIRVAPAAAKKIVR